MDTQLMIYEDRHEMKSPKGRRPSHTNLLQKAYGNLASRNSFSPKTEPCGDLSGDGLVPPVVAEHQKSIMNQFKAGNRLMTLEIMTAATLNIRGNDRAGELALAISHGDKNPLARIGVRTRERCCPACDSIVYSRRHKLCGVCGQVLPEDCLFTATEAESVEMLLRTERQRHRAWLKKTTTR
jgi:predicted nucleic acid-binding Zn ribbon protein